MNRNIRSLTSRRLIFVVLGILALGCDRTPRATGQSAAPSIRLAIIDEDHEFSKLLDLLTVEFSSKPGLEVLERSQIDRLYREQQLSASNGGYLRLGKLLGADGLLFFEKQKEGPDVFMRVRLVAVKPGVVLRDTRASWPISDPQGWVEWSANHFAPFLQKLSVSADAAVPISILNIRPESTSLDAKECARQLTVLVTERLTREREVFVLERRQMSALLSEKDLKGAGESSFWSGKYLFDGTIESNTTSNEVITVNARLIANSGSFQTIKVQGKSSDPAGISEQLTKAVMEKVKLTDSIRPWSPTTESEAYLKEGSEAYLWGMAGEAKMATDAAWALGMRTEKVAALRLCACGSDIVPRSVGNTWEIPQVPPNASLDRSIRLLTLFLRDAHLGMGSSKALSETWFYIGVYKVVAPATAVLDSYFHAAEIRPGNESQLQELRALTRQALEVLSTYTPPVKSSYPLGRNPRSTDRLARKIWTETTLWWLRGTTLWDLGWLEGGVWYDKPEDALPMLQRVLEAGYRAEGLPRIMAWSWEDRKRVPNLLKQFVTVMSAHTNPAVRIEGLSVAVMRAPFDPERQDADCVEQLAATMWAERERVWSTPENASVLKRTEKALENKYFVWPAPVVVEPFASFRQKFRLEYLQQARSYDPQVFEELFPSFSTLCTPAEARQLIPAIVAFEQRVKNSTRENPSRGIVNKLERLVATSSSTARQGTEENSSAILPPQGKDAEVVTDTSVRWPPLAEVLGKWDPVSLEQVEKAAESGDLTAQHYMGFCYGEGHRVQTNATQALRWYKRAGDAGYAPSISNTGVLYLRGKIVPRNPALALEFYRKAADMGMPHAHTNVGYLYRDGVGVQTDLREALRWFQKAAEMGDAEAMWQVYFAYRNGRGISADKIKAMAWLRRAAEAGYAFAQVQYGNRLAESDLEGIRGFKNMPEAVRWYRLSADQGCNAGQLSLASCYLDGVGVEKDEAKGLELVRLVADKGDTSASFTLAALYSRGIGQPRSPSEEPIQIFKRLVEKGRESPDSATRNACHAAFFRYQYGVGVERDLVAAAEMFCEGARQGDWYHSLKDKLQIKPARKEMANAGTYTASPEFNSLSMRYPDVSGLSEEFRLVLSHYLRAAKSESASMVEIAHRYRVGDGVPENQAKAWVWLQLAQQNGATHVAADLNSIEQNFSEAELGRARKLLPEQTTKFHAALEALENSPESDPLPFLR